MRKGYGMLECHSAEAASKGEYITLQHRMSSNILVRLKQTHSQSFCNQLLAPNSKRTRRGEGRRQFR
jgi:hypothetical protein